MSDPVTPVTTAARGGQGYRLLFKRSMLLLVTTGQVIFATITAIGVVAAIFFGFWKIWKERDRSQLTTDKVEVAAGDENSYRFHVTNIGKVDVIDLAPYLTDKHQRRCSTPYEYPYPTLGVLQPTKAVDFELAAAEYAEHPLTLYYEWHEPGGKKKIYRSNARIPRQ